MAGGGSGAAGSGDAVSLTVKRTILSIQEVVGGHSETEILAVLRETNMDPNETAQKLLYQDPFHEVKRKRDKKKEHQNIGQGNFPAVEKPVYPGDWLPNVRPQRFQNDQQRFYPRQPNGSNREFRVVRDNRIPNANVGEPRKPDHGIYHRHGRVTADVVDKRSSGAHVDTSHVSRTSLEGQAASQASTSNLDYRSRSNASDEKGGARSNVDAPDKTSTSGACLSKSDPVHVPSQSKGAGNVGTIHRQVLVANPPRRSDRASLQYANSSSYGRSAYMTKGTPYNQRPIAEHLRNGRSFGRLSYLSHKVNKFSQGTAQSKAMQPNMEWKPKASPKPPVENIEVDTASPGPPNENDTSIQAPDISSLSDKAEHAMEDNHVIIPEHLRVSESEQAQLRFGSFSFGVDSNELGTSPQESEISEKMSTLELAPVDVSTTISTSGHNETDGDGRYFPHVPSTLVSDPAVVLSENGNILDGQKGGIAPSVGLLASEVQLLPTPEEQHLQNNSSMPGFSEYDAEASNEVALFRMTDPNVTSQGSALSSEALVLVTRGDSSRVNLSSSQQLQPAQPQSASQLYAQIPSMSPYPNYMQYRHIVPPMYFPMVPNYSGGFPHTANGNNFVQMPGGNSQLAASAMKYGVSQYKSIATGSPTGYPNYTNQAGFAFNSPGVIGNTIGLEDMNRMKYKDNGVYVSNAQVDTADSIWMQTGRDISAMQPSPYYNLSGPATPTGAFLQTAGNQAFNATSTQSSHGQFQGLYHHQQPTPMVGPHHVHPQVATAPVGAPVGAVGIPGPGSQVGAYQQQQLSHLNWRPNF